MTSPAESSDANPLVVAWQERLNGGLRELLSLEAATNPDPSFVQRNCQHLLLVAIATGDQLLRQMLEDYGITTLEDMDTHCGGALFFAIQEFGDAPEVIERALNHGARINARGINEWTPLHLACSGGHIGVVRVLVAHGADVNNETRIDGGWTPIMVATAAGRKEIVEFLLDYGADPRGSLNVAKECGGAEMVSVLERYKPKKQN